MQGTVSAFEQPSVDSPRQRVSIEEVLVVEDDATTRARLAFLLKKNGFMVSLAEDGQEASELIEARHFSLVLTDWTMPRLDGLGLVERIRKANFPEYTYIILLTGLTNKANIAAGLEAGADDYITKPFDSGELLARLRVGMRILTMQKRMQDQQRKLEEIASRDGLTGVLNRRALEERLLEAFSYYQRRGPPLTVALLDMDHFKEVNDTYGHQAGDAVLKDTARRIQGVTRDYDSVGRYGGEEFLVVLPDTPVLSARSIAERIRLAVCERPVCFEELEIPVTVSVGVTVVHRPYIGDVAEVISYADQCLYRAKNSGRNQVVEIVLPEGVSSEAANFTPDLMLPRSSLSPLDLTPKPDLC